jgi:hypothetical protein
MIVCKKYREVCVTKILEHTNINTMQGFLI